MDIKSPKKVTDEPVLTPEQKAQAFIDEYKQLCEKHKLRLSITPMYMARDDGTFSTVLRQGVEPIGMNG